MIHTRSLSHRRLHNYSRWVADVARLELHLKRMDRQTAIDALSKAYSYSTVRLPD